MDNFNAWVNTLPQRTKTIGRMADGTPLTIQVASIFEDDE